ncbi:polysaccharide biosynthesis/export family protein [Litoreibacter janthinus]|uniref:SLBB domain-containing protein n=1 Tax=Litoreibacter janthinus TaxID=670154 RepID=A0A1I6FV33_9RHOB|nr:polysaccharide biosynthesis/export family protein [Litoreibacter janthinus]SFR33784.1 SLBB domain-containing protein [Litoreibacter janthinus]
MMNGLISMGKRLLMLCFTALFLSACATELPDFENSPLPVQQASFVNDTAGLRRGDTIEVSYFERFKATRGLYTLHRGDIMSFNLVGEPGSAAGTILVQEDGFASFPIVGQVRVVGMSMAQVEKRLIELFEEKLYSDPQLALTLVETFQVAASEIQSLSNRGSGDTFTVIIGDDGRISLAQLGQFNALGGAASLEKQVNARLSSKYAGRYGASVNIVQRGERAFFVMGAVNRPGRIVMDGPTAPLAAIAQAGGFVDTAAPQKVALIRYNAKGEASSWIIDLKTALMTGGKSPQRILVAERDVIYVPRSNIALTNALVRQFITNNIPIGIGYSLNSD